MAKFIYTPVGLTLTTFLARGLIKGLGRSVRLQIIGLENISSLLKNNKPGIGALWHGRTFLMIDQFRRTLKTRTKICVLASKSMDGELIARTLRKLDYHIVRGSSTRGAVSGFMGLIDAMREGYDTIITVDGPRGPKEVVKSGVVLLAQKTGYPIVPLSCNCRKSWTISSWDRYILPKPFTSGVVVIGKPVYVPSVMSKDEFEQQRKTVESELHRITRQADQYFTQREN